jgi:hypothetical protein
MLGHLSKENNLPELAYEAVRVEVAMDKARRKEEGMGGDGMKARDFPMYVASRSEPSRVIQIA